MDKKEPNIGAAILGMYGAIKICRAYGIKWQDLGVLVEPKVIENEEKEEGKKREKEKEVGKRCQQ